MMRQSTEPSFMQGGKARRQERPAGQTGAEAIKEGAERLGRFGSAMKDKSKPGDMVTRIQKYGIAENERNKKESAERKKRTTTSSVAPAKGFFGRMVDKYYHGKKEK